MKLLLLIAILALTNAQSSSFQNLVTSAASTVTVYDNTAGTFVQTNRLLSVTWTINTYGLYNLDTGVQYIAIQHILKTPVFDDDIAMFELKFLGTKVPLNATQTPLMTYDVARCVTSQNTQNPQFWNQVAKDGYYLNTVAAGVTTSTYYTDTIQDWVVWLNDDNGVAPFCTYDPAFWTPNVAKYLSIYTCTQIKCTIIRRVDTGDNYDVTLSLKNDSTDSMIIARNDASLQFNQATVTPETKASRIFNWSPVTLVVPKIASSLLLSLSAATILIGIL